MYVFIYITYLRHISPRTNFFICVDNFSKFDDTLWETLDMDLNMACVLKSSSAWNITHRAG